MGRLAGFRGMPGFEALVTLFHAEAGAQDESGSAFLKGYFSEIFLSGRRDATWSGALAFGPEALALFDAEPEHAALFDSELSTMEGLMLVSGSSVCFGAADRYHGIICDLMGEFDRAVDYYERAIALEKRMRAPVLLSRTGYWFGRTLIRAGRAEQARPILSEALATAQKLGQAWLVAKISELLST